MTWVYDLPNVRNENDSYAAWRMDGVERQSPGAVCQRYTTFGGDPTTIGDPRGPTIFNPAERV